MNLRTITVGLDPDSEPLATLEGRVAALFEVAGRRAEGTGRTVRTRRLLLPPLNGRPRFSRAALAAVVRWTSELGERCDVRWLNVPFTTFVEGGLGSSCEAALDVVQRWPTAFVNLAVAEGGQIHPDGAMAAARLIRDVAQGSRNGFNNFRVGASCNCPANAPFFPFTHHAGSLAFSAALELVAPLCEVVEAHRDEAWVALRTRLVEAVARELGEVDAIGRAVEAETGVRFAGIDASLAPYPDERHSVGRLIELLGVETYGAPGTLAATSLLTDVLRAALAGSGARAVGYHGVMSSVLEDAVLARTASGRGFGADALMSFASVCACGLDMVPIPGDTFVEEIAAMILDVAALSTTLHKPLGVRLLPIPGKQANELTDFGHDFFYNCRIFSLRNRGLAATLAHGGPFPLLAPLHSRG
jgi:uncharacterized protein